MISPLMSSSTVLTYALTILSIETAFNPGNKCPKSFSESATKPGLTTLILLFLPSSIPADNTKLCKAPLTIPPPVTPL